MLVQFFKEFVNLFPNNDKSNLANQRIREIEKIISDEIKSLEKKILFPSALFLWFILRKHPKIAVNFKYLIKYATKRSFKL